MYAEQTMPEGAQLGLAQATLRPMMRGLNQASAPSLIATVIKDLSDLTSAARSANASLLDTRNRLFGEGPELGMNAGQIRPASGGQAGDLNDALSDLRAAVYEARENAASLASLL